MKPHEKIQNAIIDLGKSVETGGMDSWSHPDMKRLPEWQGADTIITSNFGAVEHGFLNHEIVVRTRHAGAVTWLFLMLRDAFSDELNSGNKYRFYGDIAKAALKQISTEPIEGDDPRPVMRAVLRQSIGYLRELQQKDQIGCGASFILHIQDSEGRQKRVDLETGDEVS